MSGSIINLGLVFHDLTPPNILVANLWENFSLKCNCIGPNFKLSTGDPVPLNSMVYYQQVVSNIAGILFCQ